MADGRYLNIWEGKRTDISAPFFHPGEPYELQGLEAQWYPTPREPLATLELCFPSSSIKWNTFFFLNHPLCTINFILGIFKKKSPKATKAPALWWTWSFQGLSSLSQAQQDQEKLHWCQSHSDILIVVTPKITQWWDSNFRTHQNPTHDYCKNNDVVPLPRGVLAHT